MTGHLHGADTWPAARFVALCAAAILELASGRGSPAQNLSSEYNAEVPKSIVELQQFRQTNSVHIASKGGGVATLIDLNPQINAWYLLKLAWAGTSEATYHLENPKPATQKLILDANGFAILAGNNRFACDLLSGDVLAQAKAAPLIYQPLCDGRIYLRNSAAGNRTSLEAGTEFFRQHVWGGEKIIALGHELLGEIHRESGKVETNKQGPNSAAGGSGPLAALIDPQYCD